MPRFQEYFRSYKPPFLAVWGKNDPFFVPPGAETFKRDIPDAVVRFVDAGQFALETHAKEIAAARFGNSSQTSQLGLFESGQASTLRGTRS